MTVFSLKAVNTRQNMLYYFSSFILFNPTSEWLKVCTYVCNFQNDTAGTVHPDVCRMSSWWPAQLFGIFFLFVSCRWPDNHAGLRWSCRHFSHGTMNQVVAVRKKTDFNGEPLILFIIPRILWWKRQNSTMPSFTLRTRFGPSHIEGRVHLDPPPPHLPFFPPLPHGAGSDRLSLHQTVLFISCQWLHCVLHSCRWEPPEPGSFIEKYLLWNTSELNV